MSVKEAMAMFFGRLEQLYQDTFGTYPTVSWSSDLDQRLFVGEPDEDFEMQWKPADAAPVSNVELCEELKEFYGSFYYWELRGEYQGIEFSFPAVPSIESAEVVTATAISDGNYYFARQNTVFLADCSKQGNDDLLLFYRQKNGELFIYDTEKQIVLPQSYGLVDLISQMKAVF